MIGKPTPQPNAFEQGQKARTNGIKLKDNPYGPLGLDSPTQAEMWIKGWLTRDAAENAVQQHPRSG